MSLGTLVRSAAVLGGVTLLGVSLLGANRLLDDPSAPTSVGGGGNAKPPAAPPTGSAGGVILLGQVGPDPVPVGPPPVAALSTVQKVFVTDGQEVKAGDPLVQFDDRLFRAKLAQAQAGLAEADQAVVKAAAQRAAHDVLVEQQKNALAGVEARLKYAQESLTVAGDVFNRGEIDTARLRGRPVPTDEQLAQLRRENADIRRLEAGIIELRAAAENERLKLKALEQTPVAADAAAAAAKVEQLRGQVAEAQAAVELCLVSARSAGTVEQVSAEPGMTYGPSTRVPVLWLIPAGPLVVRADVESEFVSRVAGTAGKKVTVCDHNNFALTYDGVVKRVGNAFLPKRPAGETFGVGSPPRVLECLIEVPNPAPPGKPPLRVGQPVRVTFP